MNTITTILRGASLALTILSCTPAAICQEETDRTPRTLFGTDHKIHHGAWGGPSAHLTTIMGQSALLVGARGGWLIDHGITIGIVGHGLVTDVPRPEYDVYRAGLGDQLRRGSQFRMGYGGLLIEPIIAPMSPIHISLPILVGAGGCGYQTYSFRSGNNFDPFDDLDDYDDDFQAFFVVEPGIELEVNVVKLVRIGIGASYRYTTDMNLPATPKNALHGLNTGITVKVGSF